MNTSGRGTIFAGILLIALGGIFLVLNLIPGFGLGQTWPVVFFILSAGFFAPAFLWPEHRKGLAGLFIPGAILLVLGLIFLMNTLSGDWVSWAYAWLLIPGAVGLGLLMGGSLGEWGSGAFWTGMWMLVVSVGLFGLFATLFGGPALKIIGPALVIVVGAALLLRNFRRK